MAPPDSTRLFDVWSTFYDDPRLQRFTYRPLHDAIVDGLGTGPGTIVDLGCGTGQLTRRLLDERPDVAVLGVDPSAGMLARAARRLRTQPRDRVGLVRADATALPLASDRADTVVCSESFHWYPDHEAALAEIARVLRPGGRLVIGSVATITDVGAQVVERVGDAVGRRIRPLPPAGLRRLLDRAGFEVLGQRRVPRLGLVAWPALTVSRLR